MDSYRQTLPVEIGYLEQVLAFIRTELDAAAKTLAVKKTRLIAARKDMWENTVPFVNDFTRLTEINQYLSELNTQTADYGSTLKQLNRYKKIIGSPYFGRFDFKETDSISRDKIYIGLYNVMDRKTGDILVYDWRTPIAGIFYQYELGKVSYSAPTGIITGDISLKRQYRIQNSELKYFFDCSVLINDEILQEVLSRNSSPRMRNIVETIQKEQDLIIRDTDNELLIVQGVAGSGKTSIALHRIAFLLYRGLNFNINTANFLILSPNAVFSKYISSVLPDLGEENVAQTTFDDLAATQLEGKFKLETRNLQLESLIVLQDDESMAIKKQGIEFKGSRLFVQILERLIRYYERRLINFEDIYFHGKIIETGQQIKHLFLKNASGTPMARRLQRIEQMILDQVHPLQKKKLEKIEKIVANSDGHDLEVKSFSRLLSIKETNVFMKHLRKFTTVDYVDLYRVLFQKPELFLKLAQGLELPAQIEQVVRETNSSLQRGYAYYEDCAPLLYLKLRVEGGDLFSDIRQVLIDEAQDYYPLQYEVFKLLFKNARYTILGDIHQAVEKDADLSLYSVIEEILNKSRTAKLVLNKGYRSSSEINACTQNLLGKKQEFISFKRREAKPVVVFEETPDRILLTIASDIDRFFKQGYESIAVIGKTRREAENIYAELQKLTSARLVTANDAEIEKGVVVIPSYMAKGLEFDVVLIHDASRNNYSTGLDRKLLYIACTRALHQLSFYYTGEKSPFLFNWLLASVAPAEA
jgi:DNA helicase-2/ATP-dependent DNA helicase PcrA